MPRGNIHGRLGKLEASAPKPPSPPSRDFLNLRAILDELAKLRASTAHGFRGGVPIVPEDIPGKILGPDYTRDELQALAVRRALEARGEPASEVPRYVEALRAMGGRGDT